MLHPVVVPLLNPNEKEATLTSLHVQKGQRVSVGQVLAILETTKSTTELAAEVEGYVAGLRARQGDVLNAGETLCYLAERADEPLPAAPASEAQPTSADGLPDGLRITRPALELAQRARLDLERLPRGMLVTEAHVRAALAAAEPAPVEGTEYDAFGLIIYGGGGHGKSLIELLRALGGYRLVGVVDDGLLPGSNVLDVEVLGGAEILSSLFARGVRQAANAVGGIGNISSRVTVFERLAAAGFTCPTLVHPTAFVEASAILAEGVQVFPHAYVGSEARVDFGVIVNTGAIVSHDCVLGKYSNVSPGAMLAGAVQVGARCLIGMGATINLGVHIGEGARIGNGATVKADVPSGGVVRAGSVWPS